MRVTGVHSLGAAASQRGDASPSPAGLPALCMPWDGLAVHPEGLPAALHSLETLGGSQTSSEELRGKHMPQIEVLTHLATNTFGRSTGDAQRHCSSLQLVCVKCWTSEEALSGGAAFNPKGAESPQGEGAGWTRQIAKRPWPGARGVGRSEEGRWRGDAAGPW